MSRHVGQVRVREALLGVAVTAVLVGAVIALCYLLVPDGVERAALPAPPQDRAGALGGVACPAEEDLPAEPIAVTSSEVVDCPALFDGRTVAYGGEVVSAILRRGNRAWVQVNDDPYGLRLGPLPAHRTTVGGNSGLAVSIPWAVARNIDQVGGPGTYGDGLLVEGVFHRSDPVDGGNVTIQATVAQIVREGRPIDPPLRPGRVAVAAVLAVATLATATTTVRARRRP